MQVCRLPQEYTEQRGTLCKLTKHQWKCPFSGGNMKVHKHEHELGSLWCPTCNQWVPNRVARHMESVTHMKSLKIRRQPWVIAANQEKNCMFTNTCTPCTCTARTHHTPTTHAPHVLTSHMIHTHNTPWAHISIYTPTYYAYFHIALHALANFLLKRMVFAYHVRFLFLTITWRICITQF